MIFIQKNENYQWTWQPYEQPKHPWYTAKKNHEQGSILGGGGGGGGDDIFTQLVKNKRNQIFEIKKHLVPQRESAVERHCDFNLFYIIDSYVNENRCFKNKPMK